MQGKPSRRDFILGTAGVASGSIAMLALSDGASATAIDVQGLEVTDKSKSVSGPVSGLSLTVNGTWEITSDKPPTKIVLRVQGRANEVNEFTQIAATDYTADLSAEMGQDFNLSGNLLDLSGLDAPSLSPQEAGESISETVTVKVVLEVRHDMQVTETHEVQDMAEIEINRELASTNATISASGNMTVKES